MKQLKVAIVNTPASVEDIEGFINTYEGVQIIPGGHDESDERSAELIALIGAGAQIIAAFITAYFAFKKDKNKKENVSQTKIIILDRDKPVLEIDDSNIVFYKTEGAKKLEEVIANTETPLIK